MSVNAIRKQSTDDEVTSLAKSLIKSWKKLLGEFNILSVMLKAPLPDVTCCLMGVVWSVDEPAGGDRPSEEKKKEPAAPVMSQSQSSEEPREERYPEASRFGVLHIKMQDCLWM